MKDKPILFVVVMAAMLLASQTAHAAYDIYLQATGITGESTSTTHPQWCDVYSIGYGASNPINFTSTNSTTTQSKPSLSSINLMKKLDKASPTFIQYCNAGTHISTVTFEFERSVSTNQVVFYRITLEDVTVTSISQSGSAGGDDTLVESLGLDYARVRWVYYPIDAKTGKVGTAVQTGWDIPNNKAY